MIEQREVARQVLSLMDLTSLNHDDDANSISQLIGSIDASLGLPAAICVFPEFVQQVKTTLSALGWTSIKVATVTNFPKGIEPLDKVLRETQQAIEAGADEIDLVMPYQQFLLEDADTPWQYIKSSKQVIAGRAKLKVIIESGELSNSTLIAEATRLALIAGADFVKTSTGKVTTNATEDAAKSILSVLGKSTKRVGFKASGGINTLEDAYPYLILAQETFGVEGVTADTVRFGASSLLQDVYAKLR